MPIETVSQFGAALSAGASELALAGTLKRNADGTVTLSLTGTPGGGPIPPEPEPSPDTTVIHPTGGDDTSLIQGHLNQLSSGRALMLSGMFSVGQTLWLEGYEKILTGDPAKPSGIRCAAQGMSGHYGALLCTTPEAAKCRITGLEFDGQNRQAELVFFDGGEDNEISGCYLHDIPCAESGPPYAAIHSQNVVGLRVIGNRIERTGGVDGKEGVRGIWIIGRSALIEGNTVRDTGHTGIAAEGQQVEVFDNTVERSMVQGTGCKICYRAASRRHIRRVCDPTPQSGEPALHFAGNVVRSTVGAGLMLQDCGDAEVLVEECSFIDCGRQGTTFGALYSTNAANRVTVRNSRVENSRSFGGLRHARNWSLSDNTFAGGSNVLWCEDDCHNITLVRSGSVNVGSNCSGIFVDGVRKA